METRKGSNTFRMHLARVSIDGLDQPVGREATLCLRTQQDQTTIPNTSQQLMDIYIDGRLMACWDFALLKQHLLYHLIHIFSSFTLSKHISLTLPLPLKSQAEPQDYDDCLKIIRVYFTKAQDFHTAISWLTKQADLKRLDGRPASSNGVRASVSTTSEKSGRPAGRQHLAPLTQSPTSLSQETPRSRPQSRSGQHSAAQQSGPFQSQLPSLSTQKATLQYSQRAISRSQSRGTMRQAVHGFPSQRRQPILRRNIFAAQEADLPVMGSPSMEDIADGDHEISGLQMPQGGSLPKRTMSAAPLRSTRPLSYPRRDDNAFFAPTPTAVDAPTGRHSPYNFRDYARGVPSPESSQEPPILGGLYVPYLNLEPVWDGASRRSQIQSLASLSTQGTFAADSMDIDAASPHNNVPGTSRRRRVMSMAPPDARIAGASPDLLTSDWRSNTSSQVAEVGIISHTQPRSSSTTLFTSTDARGQDGSQQELRPEGGPGLCGPDQRPNDRVGGSRPPSAEALHIIRETKRKANQTMKRAVRRMSHDQDASGQVSAANNESHEATSGPIGLLAPSLDPETAAVVVRAGNEARMVNCATQTDSWPRLQENVLHLSAAMRLDSRLLRDTKQWDNLEDVNKGLLSLSTQFVQGIYDISRSA